jgi:hypothetical protein
MMDGDDDDNLWWRGGGVEKKMKHSLSWSWYLNIRLCVPLTDRRRDGP